MKLSQLAFVVTDDCNFRCSYCPQTKEPIYMSTQTVDKAVDFFYPHIQPETYIIFFGGEPLLAFDTIRHIVSRFREKDPQDQKSLRFSFTTNGSLLTDDMLRYFDDNRFSLMLSYDGTVQETGRKSGTAAALTQMVRRFVSREFPGIQFTTKSVFTPRTLRRLFESLRFLVEMGVTDVDFSIADNMAWSETDLALLRRELAALTDCLVDYYRRTGDIPVQGYRGLEKEFGPEPPGMFGCAGGDNRMAVTPGEELWGCYLFHTFFKTRPDHEDYASYCFGKLDEFIRNHEYMYRRTMFYYEALNQDNFCVGRDHCFLCDDVTHCRVCPVNAAFSAGGIGKISPWVCRMNRIERNERLRFWRMVEGERVGNVVTGVGEKSVSV